MKGGDLMNPTAEKDISTSEVLKLEAIREIMRFPGPCLTIMLPSYHRGEAAGTPAVLLNSYNQQAGKKLTELGCAASDRASLLKPLVCLAKDPTLAIGSHEGRVIFRSPGAFEQFLLTQPVTASLTIAGCFGIRKLASEMMRPPIFHILVLSKTNVKLVRCAGLDAEIVKLPRGVPDTLAEALALEPPDHDLESRSAAGRTPGCTHKIRFGTGSGHEREQAHLADYYRLVDRGLQMRLREPNTPLILAGVEEDTAIYLHVSSYHKVSLRCITGGFDLPREQGEILRQAYAILHADKLESQHRQLIAIKEGILPSRWSTDPLAILHAAFKGRVHELYLDEGAERIDMYERGIYRSWGREDLLNLAAVQTIAHHGRCYQLPSEMMPDGSIAVGIMRF